MPFTTGAYFVLTLVFLLAPSMSPTLTPSILYLWRCHLLLHQHPQTLLKIHGSFNSRVHLLCRQDIAESNICTLWIMLYSTDTALHNFFKLLVVCCVIHADCTLSPTMVVDPVSSLVLSFVLTCYHSWVHLLPLAGFLATSSICQWNIVNPSFHFSAIASFCCSLAWQLILGRRHMDVLIGGLALASVRPFSFLGLQCLDAGL